MLRRNKKPTIEVKDPPRTGLYVDVENLLDHARPFISSLIANWELDIPSPKVIYLYVRADLQVMWEMWALSQFPNIYIIVKGIQHLTRNPSKNSADIALSLDATSDFLSNKVQNVAVVSDDSDFAALFGKIHELHIERQGNPNRTPFSWIMTDRDNTKSSIITDFCPNNFIHVVGIQPEIIPQVGSSNGAKFNATALVNSVMYELASNTPSNQEIAKAIIENLPTGDFKSSNCQPIIKQLWPGHSSTDQGSAAFGIWFSSEILPELKSYGVLEPNPNRKPKQFTMTKAAKEKIETIPRHLSTAPPAPQS